MQKPGCKARGIARKLSRCGWVSFRLKAFHSDVLASRLRSLAASCRIFSRKYVMAASKPTPSPQAKGISWWHASIAFWSMASGKRPLLHTPNKDIRSGATIKYAGKCLEAAVFHNIPSRKGHRHCKLRCHTCITSGQNLEKLGKDFKQQKIENAKPGQSLLSLQFATQRPKQYSKPWCGPWNLHELFTGAPRIGNFYTCLKQKSIGIWENYLKEWISGKMQKEKLKIETLTCQKYRKTNSVRKVSIETENGNATQAMKFLRTTASCFLLSRLASAKWEKIIWSSKFLDSAATWRLWHNATWTFELMLMPRCL